MKSLQNKCMQRRAEHRFYLKIITDITTQNQKRAECIRTRWT